MKRIAITSGIAAAMLNTIMARVTFGMADLALLALPTPLDANPPTTVFFVRFWWWPLVFSTVAIIAMVTPWCRREAPRLLSILVFTLLIEVVVLGCFTAALVVPLSHVATPEMINQGVIY